MAAATETGGLIGMISGSIDALEEIGGATNCHLSVIADAINQGVIHRENLSIMYPVLGGEYGEITNPDKEGCGVLYALKKREKKRCMDDLPEALSIFGPIYFLLGPVPKLLIGISPVGSKFTSGLRYLSTRKFLKGKPMRRLFREAANAIKRKSPRWMLAAGQMIPFVGMVTMQDECFK